MAGVLGSVSLEMRVRWLYSVSIIIWRKKLSGNISEGRTAYIRYRGKIVSVSISAVAADTVAVVFPRDTRPPVVGSGVELEISDSHGEVSYHMQVVVGPDRLGDGMILQRASCVTPRQRRKSWRVDVGSNTRLRRRGLDVVFEAVLIDVSAEGALVECSERFAPMDVIELELRLPSQVTHIAPAKIVRKQKGRKSRYGVLFEELDKKARRSLTEYISHRLFEICPREVASLFPGSGRLRKLSGRRRKDT